MNNKTQPVRQPFQADHNVRQPFQADHNVRQPFQADRRGCQARKPDVRILVALLTMLITTAAMAQQPGNLSPPRQSDQAGAGFDEQDPTQAAPDMRRLLEGEQEQVRREPPPAIEVVGKVIGAGGIGKALLRVNNRYYLIGKDDVVSLPTNLEPMVYTILSVGVSGVEYRNNNDKVTRRWQ